MRAERLRRTRDIELVRSSGDVMTDRHFTIRARRNGLDVVRVAVASPRSIGGSVSRNRARRRVREALRMLLRDVPSAPGTDLFVVARRAALDSPFADLRGALARRVDAALGEAAT